jgi:hypothetical protein
MRFWQTAGSKKFHTIYEVSIHIGFTRHLKVAMGDLEVGVKLMTMHGDSPKVTIYLVGQLRPVTLLQTQGHHTLLKVSHNFWQTVSGQVVRAQTQDRPPPPKTCFHHNWGHVKVLATSTDQVKVPVTSTAHGCGGFQWIPYERKKKTFNYRKLWLLHMGDSLLNWAFKENYLSEYSNNLRHT